MIPDAERLVYTYLTGREDVDLPDGRIVGRTPQSTSGPWVKVTLLDARNDPASTVEHLISYLVQFDVYAGGQGEVITLASTIRHALTEMPAAAHAGAVVTSVRFAGMARIPDTAFEPARERVVLTSTIYAHPA